MEYGKPFEEILPFSLFTHIITHQQYLDAEFLKVANRQPSLLDRHNALLDERGEFYNEFKRESKYWADKVNDPEKILDEHSDILHFFVGWMLHRIEERKNEVDQPENPYEHHYRVLEMSYNSYYKDFNFTMKNLFNRSAFEMFIKLLYQGRVASDPFEVVAIATYVLSFNHTKTDIHMAYDKKRKENYHRISRTRKGVEDR